MRFILKLCFIYLCLSGPVSHALTTDATIFDIKKANESIDHITLQLSVQNLNVTNLENAVETLTKLINSSEEYVESLQKKINSTDILIKQNTGTVDNKNQGADLIYLNDQKKSFENEQSQSRLFAIRAKEAITAYKQAIDDMKKTEAFTRGMPIWSIIKATITSDPEIKLKQVISSDIPNSLPPTLSSVSFVLFSTALSTLLIHLLYQSKFAHNYLRLKKTHRYAKNMLLSAFICSGALLIFQLVHAATVTFSNIPLALSVVLFLYFFSMLSLVFLFSTKQIGLFFFQYSLDKYYFQNFFIGLLSFYVMGVVGDILYSSFNANSLIWQVIESSFILTSLGTAAYFIHLFGQKHPHFTLVAAHYHLIMPLSSIALITCAVIDLLGYYTMAEDLTFAILMTIIISSIAYLVSICINSAYLFLSHTGRIKTRIMKYFGYRKDQTFTEFLILKTVLQLLVILLAIYLIGEAWSFDLIENVYDELLHGVHIMEATIYPTRILCGLVVFCLLYLLSRIISTAIGHRQQFEEEEETQVAVASILTYIGFSIALISGLLVAGFDFTGLAIIAGALSVGIGLGLQSIVNNFVSGLILLIEKPIRPGDRINVDGIEGFVKKIRVRSTQIMTSAREDIIVPNSDLITRRVTNYMFSDKLYHINCEIAVAYGSDTQLVREVLLNIANHHDEVVKNNRNKPVVLFKSFADDALIFQLGCLIKDVNKKSVVRSDLNFAIEAAFREHHIDMPFQQRKNPLTIDELTLLTQQLKGTPQ